MEMHIKEDNHIVEIWLTKAEKQDTVLQEKLKSLYNKYRKEKYLVAVFISGEGDLYEGTKALLTYNKRRCAELAVMQEKRQRIEEEYV